MGSSSSKKMKPMDALVSIGVEEEKTKQAQLSLAGIQAKVDAAKVKGKLQLKVKGKLQLKETMLKHRLEECRLKLERKTEIRRLREERKKLKMELELKKLDLELSRQRSGTPLAGPSTANQSSHSLLYTTHSQSPIVASVLSPPHDTQTDTYSFMGLGLDIPIFLHVQADNLNI
jgi:hypothetical protein